MSKATDRLPRFVWNGQTLDLEAPLAAISYEMAPVAGSTIAPSGLRATLTERIERVCTMTTGALSPDEVVQLERMLVEWAALGEQVEVFVDRMLRAAWTFEGDTKDQNRGNPFRLAHAAPAASTFAFPALTKGHGLTLPSAGILRAALISDLSGGAGNAFLSAAEGTLVLAFKPSWAAADGVEHVILDTAEESDYGRNRLRIVKRANDKLYVIYTGSNGASTMLEHTPSWTADTEHTLMVQWKGLSDLKASLDGVAITTTKYMIRYGGSGLKYGSANKYGALAGGAAGNETVMTIAPTGVSLGSDLLGVQARAAGVYGLLVLYQAAYGLPDVLKDFHIAQRTYYPKGEFIDAVFRPVRITPARELHVYQFRIRDGR